MSFPSGVYESDGSYRVTVVGGGSSSGGLTDTELRASPVPVSGTLTGITNVVHVDDNSSTLSVDDGGGSLTVDGIFFQATQPVSIAGTVTTTGPLTDTQLRATAVPVSGTVTASGPLTDTQLRATAVPVSLTSTTLAGTVAATQSGTWTVQPGNTANTTAWKVDASSVAVPITDNSGSLTVDQATGTNLHTVVDSGTITTVSTLTGTTTLTPGTGATNLGKSEDGAHTDGDTGVFILGVRNDGFAARSGTDGDYTPIAVSSAGQVLTSKSSHSDMIRGTASVAATTTTSLIAASGDASLKTYVTGVQIANTGASTTLITLQDGSGGTALAYTIAPAGGGSNVWFEVPIVTTANTALFFACGTASTTVYASAQGYKAP